VGVGGDDLLLRRALAGGLLRGLFLGGHGGGRCAPVPSNQ
jgi:hypothetical protein